MQVLLPGVVDGEGDGDGCTLAKGGGDVKFAAQRADDLIDDGQPDARAAHRVFRLEKLLLDLFQVVGRDAAALVADGRADRDRRAADAAV